MYIKGGTRKAEGGTFQAGFCIHQAPVVRSSNNTTLFPPSRIASTYRRRIGVRHHSSSMRQTSPTASTDRHVSYPESRIPIGCLFASSSTSTRCGALSARSLSVLFRVPPSEFRVRSRFIVDQRVPPLGEARPWLHLDDVIQHRSSDPERDLPRGALERAPPPGTSRGARIAREQLQLRGAGGEGGELDDESLHRSSGVLSGAAMRSRVADGSLRVASASQEAPCSSSACTRTTCTSPPLRRGSPSARSTSLSRAWASRSRSPTGVKNVRAATIGSGTIRPTTGSDTSPAASRHSRRPARPNCDTTASSGSATSAPSVLTPSCSSRRKTLGALVALPE